MDQATLQQLVYAEAFLSKWIGQGPSVWCFTEAKPVKTDVKMHGKFLDTKELSDYAISAKRSGNYAEALGAYLQVMMACFNASGKIPVVYVRGLFKVLVCVNYFETAFTLVSTICADMQQSGGVIDSEEQGLFQQYFLQLASLSVQVIDNGDTSNILAFAANYSGSNSYSLQRSMTEIKEEMSHIRQTIRQIYGQ